MSSKKKEEFYQHIWDHTQDAFFETFVNPKKLTENEKATMKEIICILCQDNTDRITCDKIFKILQKEPKDSNLIPLILQLIGSTRNKILTDLKSMFSSTGISVPTKPEHLVGDKTLLRSAEKILTGELRRVFSTVIEKDCDVDNDTLYMILEILNQSTWSGYVRQEKAKRTGHYAEYMLARELDKFDIPFEPREKLTNPLSRDATFNGLSYDIMIPDDKTPQICVKATIHTSNIGQYGESKDSLEIMEAKENLSKLGRNRPKLIALIDGIGMTTNVAGLEGVLNNADEFIQFKTLWKIIAVYAHANHKNVTMWLPDPPIHDSFLKKYSRVRLSPSRDGLTEIGEAYLKLE